MDQNPVCSKWILCPEVYGTQMDGPNNMPEESRFLLEIFHPIEGEFHRETVKLGASHKSGDQKSKKSRMLQGFP
jgi:hypothetical protein